MAPPSPRRSGFSRRAQYGIFATYVIAVIGAIFALLLALTERLDPKGHAALQLVVSDLTAPLSQLGRSVTSGLGGVGETIGAYFNAASKNKAMEAELRASRVKLVQGQADAMEVKRLKQLLAVRDVATQPIIAARLVSSSSSSSRRYATLAAGRNAGVVEGQVVRSVDGLIGSVIQAGQISARVRMIIDGKSIIPVKRASDNTPAQIIGLGDGRLEVRGLAAGQSPFKPGDVFITSGAGGVYRPGIPVAVVTQRTQSRTFARPAADPTSFDYALVEAPFVAPPPLPQAEQDAEAADKAVSSQ
ncbi:MAG: rod shape-determining protein MreC [Pseudomonadota bacterium]|jgi:rod shape-determining protein MreC